MALGKPGKTAKVRSSKYSRVQNKRSPMIINFLTFFPILRLFIPTVPYLLLLTFAVLPGFPKAICYDICCVMYGMCIAFRFIHAF